MNESPTSHLILLIAAMAAVGIFYYSGAHYNNGISQIPPRASQTPPLLFENPLQQAISNKNTAVYTPPVP